MMKPVYAAFLFLLFATATAASASQYPKVGETLPAFTMPALALEEDAAALGLAPNRAFTLADIKTPYVLIEIIGVYCPVCHEQESMLTKLYKRFRKTGLDERITMLGIAAGGTPMEVKFIRKKNYLFPMVHDTEYEIYNAIGDTKTPFTMLVDKQGMVLFAHQGLLPDIGTFLKEIEALVQ
jgi:peroxiredoxin